MAHRGIFSARYGGIPSSSETNNAKLLQELVAGRCDHTAAAGNARYRCVLVIALCNGQLVESFDGVCEGDDRAWAAKGDRRLSVTIRFLCAAGLCADLWPARRQDQGQPEPPRAGAKEVH